MAFCQSCGAEVLPQAIVCVKCGAGVPHVGSTSGQVGPVSEKSWVATLLLCFFLGWCGAHRFYTGHIGIAVAQLLTLGGCGMTHALVAVARLDLAGAWRANPLVAVVLPLLVVVYLRFAIRTLRGWRALG